MPVGLATSTPVYPSSIGTGVRPDSPAIPGGQGTSTPAESQRPVSSGSDSAPPGGTESNRSARAPSNPSGQDTTQQPAPEAGEGSDSAAGADASARRGIDGEVLTRSELREVRQLEARDREVRSHEKAHQATGGQYAGSPQYAYTQGPDGDRYATGGEVSIDATPIKGDPQATLEKMRTVRAAALAPANPSAQDQQVAVEATQAMLQAQLQLARQEQGGDRPEAPPGRDGDSADADSPGDRNGSSTTTYESVASTGDSANTNTEPFRASA